MTEGRGPSPLTSGVLVFLLFVAVGIAYTFPLIRHASSGLPYTHAPQRGAELVERTQGDYLQFYYHLWLFQDAAAGRTPLFSNPYEFAWDGPRPRFWTYFLPVSLVYLAFTPLGNYVAYNVFVIVSFGLAGLAMFLFTRELGGGRAAALVAATVFALAPYRYAALAGGHPAGAAFFLVPLTLLGVERSLRRGSRGGSLLAGAGLLSLAFVEPHFLYFLLLLLPPLILVRTLPLPREWPRAGGSGLRSLSAAATRTLWPLWPLALCALAAVGVMLYVKATTLDASVARTGRSLHEIGLFSPDPGDWLIRFNEAAGRSIYPGAVAVTLAGVGVAAGWAARATRAPRGLGFFALLFLLAEILSLGPRAAAPLYGWLYGLIPFFGFVRQTGKFQVLAVTALALLAAAGTQRVVHAIGRRGWAATAAGAVLVAAVAGDYWPARPIGVSLLPTDNRVYALLRSTDAGRVLYLPIWPGDSSWSSLYEFTTTLTRRPMVNGYSPMGSRRYVDEVYWPLDHLNRGELTEREHERLRALGVRLVVLDRGAFPPKVSPFPSHFTLERLRVSPYVDLLGSQEPLWLFALREAPRASAVPLPTSPGGRVFEAERRPPQVGAGVADPDATWGRAVRAGAALSGLGPVRASPARAISSSGREPACPAATTGSSFGCGGTDRAGGTSEGSRQSPTAAPGRSPRARSPERPSPAPTRTRS